MKKTIVIFDDDTDILELCKILLKGRGYNVITYDNCRDIIQKVTSVSADLVLMDNKIPDLGGIAATRELKANDTTRAIPVIYFSANTNVEQLSREAAADGFLQKPFNISDLEKIVERYTWQSTN
jgi:CheY-like chemotaxis protein